MIKKDTVKTFSNTTIDNISYLTDIFTKISGIEKRSLSSKYLHFHFPDLFFLYDSRAVTSSRRLLPRFKAEIPPKNVDKEYGNFFSDYTICVT